ncbi:MAG: PqqD family protein [bacterium]|nr:PqqD family protein [bacterium]
MHNFLSRIYKRNPNFVYRKVVDEVILVPIKAEAVEAHSIVVLNETSAFIWELLDGKKSLKEISENLTNKFEVSPKTAENDLITFIKDIEKLGGITLISGSR